MERNLRSKLRNLFTRRPLRYIVDLRPSTLEPLTKKQYDNDLRQDTERAKAAFDKAWAIRNFEIEMYWKRASYFWAFIASTFVGYFALTSSEKYYIPDRSNHAEVYLIICFGFTLSIGWLLTNIGSKGWQRHWEIHVDQLEDPFTGPLYKTVHQNRSFSVSKINEIVSLMVACIWFLLGAKFLSDQNLWNLWGGSPNWFVLISTIGTVIAIVAMIWGHGRGRFLDRTVTMYRRKDSLRWGDDRKNHRQ